MEAAGKMAAGPPTALHRLRCSSCYYMIWSSAIGSHQQISWVTAMWPHSARLTRGLSFHGGSSPRKGSVAGTMSHLPNVMQCSLNAQGYPALVRYSSG